MFSASLTKPINVMYTEDVRHRSVRLEAPSILNLHIKNTVLTTTNGYWSLMYCHTFICRLKLSMGFNRCGQKCSLLACAYYLVQLELEPHCTGPLPSQACSNLQETRIRFPFEVQHYFRETMGGQLDLHAQSSMITCFLLGSYLHIGFYSVLIEISSSCIVG